MFKINVIKNNDKNFFSLLFILKVVPKLNLKVSVTSDELFDNGCANEKLNGPTGEYQSRPPNRASYFA